MNNPQPATGEQVKAAMIAADIRRVDHHNCSGCGVMVFYFRVGEQLFFDPGCGCTRGRFEPRSWQSAAEWINMQSDPRWRDEIAASFGFPTRDKPDA